MVNSSNSLKLNLVAASSLLIVAVTFLLTYDENSQHSKLQVPVYFARSQVLAPYQYNYNRPEAIPTLPASSDISYTVSPEVISYRICDADFFCCNVSRI